jgi:hypothetical protein
MLLNQAPASWLARRLFPLLATVGLVAAGMASADWWGPAVLSRSAWSLPHDLWGTMLAAQRLLHGDLAGLYTPQTGLVTLPGAVLLLVPVVAVADAAGLSLRVPGPHNPHPGLWLLAGPCEIVLSAVVLFAADALAERLGASRAKRALLAGAGAVALWSVSARWGHPEDAVAVALLLAAIGALHDGRTSRAAWLTGAALAVQPLVLLALPVVLTVVAPRRLPGFLLRAAAPPAVLLAAAAAANWTATVSAVTSQPNWPAIDHPTPWTSLAPHLSHGAVAAGPVRTLALAAACACGLVLARRWRAARAPDTEWDPPDLRVLLWWVAVSLALRSLFEPVMVPYYVWPPLAVALIAASPSWRRLLATGVAVAAVTGLSQGQWRGVWTWWVPVIALLALTLAAAWVPRGSPAQPGGARPRRMVSRPAR